MKINYKEPYWIKFSWDLTNNHDDQYITNFDKADNDLFFEFQNNDRFIINCEFNIQDDFKTDFYSHVFGKPGKNMGLTYCANSNTLSFEFWTTKEHKDDVFNYIPIKLSNPYTEISKGLIITIIRDVNEIIVYKNFELNNSLKFEENFIPDYNSTGVFLGCSNPGASVPEHRYYGEVDIKHFTIINNNSDIEIVKDLYFTESEKIITKDYYSDILCLYDFKLSNNLGIFYDESKYNNFLEKVPSKFLLK